MNYKAIFKSKTNIFKTKTKINGIKQKIMKVFLFLCLYRNFEMIMEERKW